MSKQPENRGTACKPEGLSLRRRTYEVGMRTLLYVGAGITCALLVFCTAAFPT